MWHPQRANSVRLDEAQLLDVLTDAAKGDFGARMRLDQGGVPGSIAARLNEVIAANQTLAGELARVSRVVGKEGQLAQRVALPAFDHPWFASIESVNSLIDDLVRPATELQRVIGAVAHGDLSTKITGDVHGEALELKNTVNAMVDQLNRFASEVTRVAREVGVEGRLGGQAQSAEVAGVWKDLTDNVNQLAANLTSQVRAIADVATAVTEGDLTQQVGVHASGEVAVLKDKLNEMIRTLRDTTRENTEQDWLKTNLERFARMLQGHRDLATVSRMILSELASVVSAQYSVFYTLAVPDGDSEPVLQRQAGYGSSAGAEYPQRFRLGEGLVGQCALEKQRIVLTDVPSDYAPISSGIGAARPLNVIIWPILFEGSVRAVLELASFSRFTPAHEAFLDRLTESIGLVLNTIEANTLTETLLERAQSQAQELTARQEELRSSNADLARKAEQLAISSTYKSEFFANMSHELRTPLNSLLILARELQDNAGQNLTEAQVQYASVIHSSGSDLMGLLNDILDLAKVESGTVVPEVSRVDLSEFVEALELEFRQLAEQKGVAFVVDLAPGLPASIATDPRRLRQVLKNLLSNAFKFTDHGEVCLSVAPDGRPGEADGTLTFAIRDTGIGIPPDLRQRIFEAFTQVDGTTAREYGGTGLGLSISSELVRLLGGEIMLISAPGTGSTFTVSMPPMALADPIAAVLPDAPAAKSSPRSLSRPALAGRKVLIVDDDFSNIFALTTLLERGLLEVVSAENGGDGVEILRCTPGIDIVLVDIMMPVMDGYATIRAMRELPGKAPLPIVAVTASVATGERQRCIEAGASAYVTKPVDSDALLDLLEEWIPPAAARPAPLGVH